MTTYALFDSPNDGRETAKILARVAAFRKGLGLPALAVLRAKGELVRQAQLVLAGEREPSQALEAAMQAALAWFCTPRTEPLPCR